MKLKTVTLVVLLAAASAGAAASLPFTLLAKQEKQYASQANFPATSPELRADRQDNRIGAGTKGSYHLLALAGPKGKMMSFQVGTLSNPEIRIPVGTKLTLDVVNVDDDMVHDLYLTTVAPPYPQAVAATAIGTAVLKPYKGEQYMAAQLVLQAKRAGTVYYVCTVPGHAKRGMYGKIVITP